MRSLAGRVRAGPRTPAPGARAPSDAIGRLAQYVLIPRIAAPGMTLVVVQRNPNLAEVLLLIVPLMMALNYLALRYWDQVVSDLRVADKSHYLLLDSALALIVLAVVGLGTPMVLYLIATGVLAGLIYPARLVLMVTGLSLFGYVVLEITRIGYVPGARDFHTTVTLPALLLVAGPAGIALRGVLEQQERTAVQLAELREGAAIRDERLRMARDLHDSLTKNLHGVWLLSRTLERALDRGELTEARGAAQVIGDTAQGLSGQARSVIIGLRDQVQADRPLVEALREATERTVAGHPIAVEVRDRRARPGLAPAPEVGHELLAIAVEALHNAVKHSWAQHIRIDLADVDGGLELTVVDDGQGFSDDRIDRMPQDGHFGLLGMRERADRVGGRLTVRSSPGHGASIRFWLPGPPRRSRKPPAQNVAPSGTAWIDERKVMPGHA